MSKEIGDLFREEILKVLKWIEQAQSMNIDRFLKAIKVNLEASLLASLAVAKEMVHKQIMNAAQEGANRAMRFTPKKLQIPAIELLGQEKMQKQLVKYFNLTYIEIARSTKTAYKDLFNRLDKEIKKSPEIVTVNKAKEKLVEALTKEGVLNVPYKGGKKMPVDVYAEMRARTGRQEAFNNSAIEYAKSVTDLVQCTTIFPTCSICGMYQGRVYSISGKTDEYPALFKTALSNKDVLIMHPNCRHQFLPYFPEFADAGSEGQAERDKRKSNEPFKDTRSKKNREEYAEWQADNQRKYARRQARLAKKKQQQ